MTLDTATRGPRPSIPTQDWPQQEVHREGFRLPGNGVGLAVPYEWSFTRRSRRTPGECPCTLFDDADGPTSGPESDTNRVRLGVAFTSNTAGTIRGVRFYKAAGTAAPTRSRCGRPRYATRRPPRSPGRAAPAGRQATFAQPGEHQRQHDLHRVYLAPNGRYSADPGGLSAKIRPVTAVELWPTAGATPTGRARPRASRRPTTSSTRFSPCRLIRRRTCCRPSPGDDADSVPVGIKPTANFNDEIQPGTAAIVVTRTSNGSEIDGAVTDSTSGTAASFVPTNPLPAGTKFTMTISGAKSTSWTRRAHPSPEASRPPEPTPARVP